MDSLCCALPILWGCAGGLALTLPGCGQAIEDQTDVPEATEERSNSGPELSSTTTSSSAEAAGVASSASESRLLDRPARSFEEDRTQRRGVANAPYSFDTTGIGPGRYPIWSETRTLGETGEKETARKIRFGPIQSAPIRFGPIPFASSRPCASGYERNGHGRCVDIDECATANGGCDPLAVCINRPGGRTCGPCPLGYVGWGDTGCSDFDECAWGHGGCDALATCTNTVGGQICGSCPPGYVGTGDRGCRDPAWYDPRWGFRKRITIQHDSVAADLSDFPVVLAINDADWAAHALPNGDDLVFTSGDGTTRLEWEIERWDALSGALAAWVRIPALSASEDTALFVYYGNSMASNQQTPGAVWDANYAAVWHLNNDPSSGVGAIKDSTSNTNDGTSGGDMPANALVRGKIGAAMRFDGSDDLLNMGNRPSLNNLDPMTLEGWLCLAGAGQRNPRLVSKQVDDGTEPPLSLSVPTASGRCTSPGNGVHCVYFTRSREISNLVDMTPNYVVSQAAGCTWTHVAVTMDTTRSPASQVYVDGLPAPGKTTSGEGPLADDASYPLVLANNRAGTRSFQGQLDEWRVSNTARSAAWISTSFENQNNPASFSTFGIEQAQGQPPVPAITGDELVGRPTDHSVTVGAMADGAIEVSFDYGTDSGVYSRSTAPAIARDGLVKTVISGLRPNTRYYYRMRYRAGNDAGPWSTREEHSFHTQRSADGSFTFTIQSDSHQGYASFYDAELYAITLANVAADNPDFHMDLGDAISLDDARESAVSVRRKYLEQRRSFTRVGHSAAIFLVLGNHENEEGWNLDDFGDDRAASLPVLGANARKTYFLNPVPDAFYTGNDDNAVREVLGDHLREDYYAFTWGAALFVVLDPYFYTMRKPYAGAIGGEKNDEEVGNRWDWTLGDRQYRWLERVLETSSATFKFVFAHNPTGGVEDYSRGGARGARYCEWGGFNVDGSWGFDANRPDWDYPIHSLMVDNGVTAFFHGHDHVFAYELLDGVVYQEVPFAASPRGGLGFPDNRTYYEGGVLVENSGHLRVTVLPSEAQVDYVRAFAPADGTNGSVAYSYVMTPKPRNGRPVARDDTAATDRGAPVVLNVLENDDDPDAQDVLSVIGVTQPAHGRVVVHGTNLSYEPEADYCDSATPDRFRYTVSDGHAGIGRAFATVTVRCPGDPVE